MLTATSNTIQPASTQKPKKSSAQSRARDLLRGVIREDSDDELGYEDLPWEWIYSKTKGPGAPFIVGAQMGTFDVRIGDCILLKGEGLKGEAYVGIACEFREGTGDDQGEMVCNVMWFSTESEIRPGKKKRADFLPVSLISNLIACDAFESELVFDDVFVQRMNYISIRHTMKCHCHPSMDAPLSYQRLHITNGIPTAFRRNPKSLERCLFVGEAVIHALLPTLTSLTGMIFGRGAIPIYSCLASFSRREAQRLHKKRRHRLWQLRAMGKSGNGK
jgi:hypothetical protein